MEPDRRPRYKETDPPGTPRTSGSMVIGGRVPLALVSDFARVESDSPHMRPSLAPRLRQVAHATPQAAGLLSSPEIALSLQEKPRNASDARGSKIPTVDGHNPGGKPGNWCSVAGCFASPASASLKGRVTSNPRDKCRAIVVESELQQLKLHSWGQTFSSACRLSEIWAALSPACSRLAQLQEKNKPRKHD